VDYVEEGKAKESNMAILEVSLPSGYTVDEDSFKEIRQIERVRVSLKAPPIMNFFFYFNSIIISFTVGGDQER